MMQTSEIELSRAVEAIQIPSGDSVTLPAGTKVMITQSLGGTYTVATEAGLARIPEKEADALGIEPSADGGESPEALEDGDMEGAVWQQLKLVYDPEIPVNIVDLGLVYDFRIAEDEGKTKVEIKMTLTAPGCGMGPTIAADARSKVLTIDGVDDALVDLVWDPPWTQEMISEEGKMKLGMV
ncbi:MAG: putative Fe-S cluster assembly protein SufT [Verrucomicrobiales bacterium]